MVKKLLLILGGLTLGIIVGYFVNNITPLKNAAFIPANFLFSKNEVIGFLPYWLTPKAKNDYSKDISTLTYFSLTLDTDGTILKMTNPQEEDPGWFSLSSGKMDPFFEAARKNNQTLSLLVFAGNQASIDQLVADPETHANNLIAEITPVMKQYGFGDLNLDIESVAEASPAAQLNFTRFVRTVKNGLDSSKSGTLTVDVSPTDLIKPRLIDPKSVAQSADKVVLMTYDYHYIGSLVSGPVAPVGGAGTESEYDINTALEKALAVMNPKKIILGAPLYGYEWETLGDFPRAAVIPSTGLIASNERVEELLATCASCSARLDPTARESYIIYKDQDTGTYHQIFYPDQSATEAKVQIAKDLGLGGIAVWALGYEGPTILAPLDGYRR